MEILPLLLITCFVPQVYSEQTKCSNESTIELSCPIQQVIRVLEKLVVCCSDMDDCIATSPCVHRLPPSELRPLCNGRQLCNETVLVSEHTLCLNGTLPVYFQVNYTCVGGSLITNICSDEMVLPDSPYLATPDFPGQTLHVSRPSCQCRVQGVNITVTAVQIDLLSNSSSLTLSDVTDGSTLWPSVQAQPVPLYNTVLYTGRGLQTLDIVFNQTDDQNQTAWIEVKANPTVNISCGLRVRLITPSPTSWTMTTPSAPSVSEFSSTVQIYNSSALNSSGINVSTTENMTVTSLDSSSTSSASFDSSMTVEQLSSLLETTPTSCTSTASLSSPSTLTLTSSLPPCVATATNQAKYCGDILSQCERKLNPLNRNEDSQGGGSSAQIIVPVLVSLVVIAAVIIICVFMRRRRAGQRTKADDPERSAAANLYTVDKKSKPDVSKEPDASGKSTDKTTGEPETEAPGDSVVRILNGDSVAYASEPHGVGEITAPRIESAEDSKSGKTAEEQVKKTDWPGQNECLGYTEVEIHKDSSVPTLLEKGCSSKDQSKKAQSDKRLVDERANFSSPSSLKQTHDTSTESQGAEAPILKPEFSLRSKPAGVPGSPAMVQDHANGTLSHHYSEIDPVPKNEAAEPRTPAPPPTPHHYSDIVLPDDSVSQARDEDTAKPPHHTYWVLEREFDATAKTKAKKPGKFNVEIVPLKRSKSVEPHPLERSPVQFRGRSERQKVSDPSEDQRRPMDTPTPNPAQGCATLSNAYADINEDEVLDMKPISRSNHPLPPPPPPPAAAAMTPPATAALVAPHIPDQDPYSVAHGYEPAAAGGNSPKAVLPVSTGDKSVSSSGLYEDIDKSLWQTGTPPKSSPSSADGDLDAGTSQAGSAVNDLPFQQNQPASDRDKKDDVLVYNILYESFQNVNKNTEK